MEDDASILSMLKEQDPQAMERLYDRYAPALYGVVLKIVGSETVAEDVLQEAWVKIWKNGSTFDPDRGSLFTWLLNICRNTAIDQVRSAGFRATQKTTDLGIPQQEQALADEGLNVQTVGIRSSVEALDEKYRTVIDLVYFQGYTQKEVEAYLGIPLGTVKSRIRIALQILRNLFDDVHILLLPAIWLSLSV